MKTFFFLLIAVSFCLLAYSQTRPRFSSQNYAGILEGQSGTSFQMQTINGVRCRGWFGGLGTGIDYYYHRSVPLFLSVSKIVGNAKVPLYLTADLGTNVPWVRKDRIWFGFPGSFSGGQYWGAGLGYRLAFRNSEHALLLNLGYNYKRLIEVFERANPCFVPPCPGEKQTVDYRLRRLSVRVGWTF